LLLRTPRRFLAAGVSGKLLKRLNNMMNFGKRNPKIKELVYVVGGIVAIYVVSAAIMIFDYGYKPERFLDEYEGIVEDVDIRILVSKSRSGGFIGIEMDVKENIKSKNSVSFYISEFSSEKRDLMLKSIRIGSKVKIKYFSKREVVYADFDYGYKISQHSKIAGTLVFYIFFIAIPLYVFFYYLNVYSKHFN